MHNLIRKTKIDYDKNIIESIKNDCKRMWSYVNNKLFNKRKTNVQIRGLKHEIGNRSVESERDIANYFGEFFSSIGDRLACRLDKEENNEYFDNFITPNNLNTIFVPTISDQEVYETILSLKIKPGAVDDIDTRVIKNISPLISKSLATLFNLSIETGTFPKHFKTAIVVPIYKAGDKTNVTNYRPISLISNLAKIFEKILHKRIMEFLIKSNYLSKYQYGFRPSMGTDNAFAYVSKFLHENLDNSSPTVGIFLDLAKAFDTVDHKILLKKLTNAGIRGKLHNLLTNYLEDRKQIVKINQTLSNPCKLTTGVPQGTILGPLLFLIYINDIFSALPEGCVVSYADDTILLVSGETWLKVEQKANEHLKKIYSWLGQNKLSLNLDKSVYIMFTNHMDTKPTNFVLKINKRVINPVQSTKYLGITIDSTLKWTSHIKNIVKKTRYLIFVMAKLKNLLNTESLLSIYHGLFKSVATYGIIAWGSAYENAILPLIKLQKRIIAIIFLNKNSTLKENLLHITHDYYLKCLTIHWSRLKKEYNRSKSISRSANLILPQVSLNVGKKSHYFIAIKLFNSLPKKIKNYSTITRSARKILKLHIRNSSLKILQVC